jgi:hypothetical protein
MRYLITVTSLSYASLANVSAGKDLPLVRVLDQVKFLLGAGIVASDIAGPTCRGDGYGRLLPVASVRKALDRVNPELRHTLRDENGRRARSTETGPLGRNSWYEGLL